MSTPSCFYSYTVTPKRLMSNSNVLFKVQLGADRLFSPSLVLPLLCCFVKLAENAKLLKTDFKAKQLKTSLMKIDFDAKQVKSAILKKWWIPIICSLYWGIMLSETGSHAPSQNSLHCLAFSLFPSNLPFNISHAAKYITKLQLRSLFSVPSDSTL